MKPRDSSQKQNPRHNYRLRVEYDGTRYHGFQVQPAQRTVAGELGAALGALLGAPATLIGSGRTDAGVHAESQVVNFLSPKPLELEALVQGLNERLPADINVLEAELADPGFHARSHAISRTYRYQVSTRRDAFRKRFVWWIRARVAADLLAAEARAIVGQHDFAAFSEPDEADCMIRVSRAAWTSRDTLLLFHISAERFARKMVRRLVGAMLEVGLRREKPGLVARLLQAGTPGQSAAWTAPPSGLFLESVEYPETARGGPEAPLRRARSSGR